MALIFFFACFIEFFLYTSLWNNKCFFPQDPFRKLFFYSLVCSGGTGPALLPSWLTQNIAVTRELLPCCFFERHFAPSTQKSEFSTLGQQQKKTSFFPWRALLVTFPRLFGICANYPQIERPPPLFFSVPQTSSISAFSNSPPINRSPHPPLARLWKPSPPASVISLLRTWFADRPKTFFCNSLLSLI